MFKNYISMALRVLKRRKFFTFASLFGISFTLCVLIIATSFLDHVFAAKAPESNLDRMLYVSRMTLRGEGNTSTSSPGYKFLNDHIRDIPGAELISISSQEIPVASYQTGSKYELNRRRTDGNFWQIFDFHFVEGAPYTEEDNRTANPVAVINVKTRDRLFDGRSAIDETVTIDGQSFRVVGVVEDVSRFRESPYSDVWVPLTTEKSTAYLDSFMGGFQAVILARNKADRERLQSEVEARVNAVDLSDRKPYDSLYVHAYTLVERISRGLLSSDEEVPRVWAFRTLIVVGMLLFMLLPSLNLVNLNLSRTLERASEIGVRRAFGAWRGSLLIQFLVENVIVTLIGGLIGLAMATVVITMLNNSQVAQYLEFAINLRVFAWGLVLAVIFGVLSGIYPAWRMSRLSPVAALRSRGVR